MTVAVAPVLIDRIWQANGPIERVIRNVALAFAGTAFLTISAKISVPMYPVPMTMQTLAVVLVGAVFGMRLGFATVVLYLAEGALGLPVFQGTPALGIGLPYMIGPTGGYLVGFALAAGLVGWMAEHGAARSMLRMAGAATLAHVVIVGLGFLWLAQLRGLTVAWEAGVVLFLFGSVLKIAIAALAVPTIEKL